MGCECIVYGSNYTLVTGLGLYLRSACTKISGSLHFKIFISSALFFSFSKIFFSITKKKFVTKFVTCITKFVICVTKFVTCVRNFVTKTSCAERKKYLHM